MKNIKGFKVFNSDWTCRDFQYKVGETYIHEGNIELCGAGFHFCQKVSDCFNYYSFNSENKVAEIEAMDLVETQNDKSVTNKIKIVREISWQELLTIANEGRDCTGLYNTGNKNTGNRNTGDCNTGNKNTGNRNTGDCNTGNKNTGDWNTGDWNTGNKNTGDWNTGDWNTINNSSNVFSSVEEKIKIFDKETNITLQEWRDSKAARLLNWNSELAAWIYSENMSEEEKIANPQYLTTGGYLKVFTHKEMCTNMWNNLTNEEKDIIKNIPNFDANKFKLITGIEV